MSPSARALGDSSPEPRAFPKLLNTAEGGLMAWLRGWMGDSSWGRNPGSGAGMTRVTLLRLWKGPNRSRGRVESAGALVYKWPGCKFSTGDDPWVTGTYRVGLVGLRGITSKGVEEPPPPFRTAINHSHAAGLSISDRFDVVAVCDLVPELLDDFGRTWGERGGPTWAITPTSARCCASPTWTC